MNEARFYHMRAENILITTSSSRVFPRLNSSVRLHSIMSEPLLLLVCPWWSGRRPVVSVCRVTAAGQSRYFIRVFPTSVTRAINIWLLVPSVTGAVNFWLSILWRIMVHTRRLTTHVRKLMLRRRWSWMRYFTRNLVSGMDGNVSSHRSVKVRFQICSFNSRTTSTLIKNVYNSSINGLISYAMK